MTNIYLSVCLSIILPVYIVNRSLTFLHQCLHTGAIHRKIASARRQVHVGRHGRLGHVLIGHFLHGGQSTGRVVCRGGGGGGIDKFCRCLFGNLIWIGIAVVDDEDEDDDITSP